MQRLTSSDSGEADRGASEEGVDEVEGDHGEGDDNGGAGGKPRQLDKRPGRPDEG